jgi:hypothetical protein
MKLRTRIAGAARRRCRRLYYERFRPELSLADLYAELDGAVGIDLTAPDGFQRLWRAHCERTPAGLWAVMPPAAPDVVERARRSEARVLERRVTVTPETDWSRDPFHAVPWPMVHVDSFPYSIPGADLVLLWHLNRMGFLVEDTAAWRATGDPAVAERVPALMESWARANPYLVGANWISPMETGLRLAAWSFALAGMTDAPDPSPGRCETILRSVVRQARFLSTHFSGWAIPNNHLIGEASLLYSFSVYWPVFRRTTEWRDMAESTLVVEARRQVLADGFHFENSVNYHLVVLDYFLVYLHAKLLAGETPHPVILEKTRSLAGAALALAAPSGRMPMIGDDSMPHFVILGGIMGSPGPVSGHAVFEDMLRIEHARLFTTTPWGRELLSLRCPETHTRRFEEAGIDIARGGHGHVVFTHGPQHRRTFSHGHLHADAGSFELELAGTPVIIDPGTYLYGDPDVRSHMRGARAHNTVIIDGIDPMRPSGTFGWQSIAAGEALAFGAVDDVTAAGCRRRLPGREGAEFDHVRALVRVGSTLIVADALSPRAGADGGAHDAELYFHTTVPSGAAAVDGLHVRLADAARFVRVFEVLDEPAALIEVLDRPDDLASMYSTVYGERSTGATIRVRVPLTRPTVVLTVLRDPATGVRRAHTRTGFVACVIEQAHRRHVVGIRLDPFAVHVGGRAIAAAPGAMPESHRDSNSLAWLDELDV